MMRTETREYLIRRVEGDLEERPSMLDKAMNPNRKWKTRTPRFEHILCPDPSTLETFVAGSFHFLNPRIHRAVACFEGIPAWLRFLESTKLIDIDLRKRTYHLVF